MIRQIAILSNASPATNDRLSRRALLAGSFAATVARPAIARAMTPAERAWGGFAERFLQGGRVIDTGNGGVSHSEGQGTAMLAAARLGDRQRFDEIYSWTRETLSRPYDSLHAWRYRPNAPVKVDDPNNATDGDVLIAWALFTAARRWDNGGYRAAAQALTRDITRALVTRTSFGTVLLPGIAGFVDQHGLTLNPSYYLFPAIKVLAAEMPDAVWSPLWDDGLKLIRIARFGRWGLPPDWLSVTSDGAASPSTKWPMRFSFDAVRVPLYMCWAGLAHDPVIDAIQQFWNSHNDAPAWTDLRSNELAPYLQTVGMMAIRRYVAALRAPTSKAIDLPLIATAPDYYSGALVLLVNLAMEEPAPGLA